MFSNLSDKSNLIVSGCSMATGQGLENREIDAWPILLKNKLNLNLINLSRGSMGNEYVFNSVIDYFIQNIENKKNSLVLCSITSITRIQFFDPKNNEIFSTIPSNKDALTELFFEEYYDDEYYLTKFLRDVILTQTFFENNKIDYFFFNVIPLLHLAKKIKPNHQIKYLLKNINMDRYLWFYKKPITNIISANQLPCLHPNEQGNKLIAELLYDKIKKEFNNDKKNNC